MNWFILSPLLLVASAYCGKVTSLSNYKDAYNAVGTDCILSYTSYDKNIRTPNSNYATIRVGVYISNAIMFDGRPGGIADARLRIFKTKKSPTTKFKSTDFYTAKLYQVKTSGQRVHISDFKQKISDEGWLEYNILKVAKVWINATRNVWEGYNFAVAVEDGSGYKLNPHDFGIEDSLNAPDTKLPLSVLLFYTLLSPSISFVKNPPALCQTCLNAFPKYPHCNVTKGVEQVDQIHQSLLPLSKYQV